jgi:hypothetical protein
MFEQADQYFVSGKKSLRLGNLNEAIKYFQKAVAINPYFAEAHYELAQAYETKGWTEKADQSYQAAANLNPKLSPPISQPYFEEDGHRKLAQEAEAWGKEIERKRWAKDRLMEQRAREEPIMQKSYASRRAEAYLPLAQVSYLETTVKELHKAQEKGPTVNTILDPYHPKHKDFSVPYIKDREGLKLTPIVGVRGEYMVDRQPVGIETLIQDAQEFNQRTDEQAKKYLSLNDKEYHREEVVLHYNETWPRFTYAYYEERVRREYDGKLRWSTNNVYYDNYNKRYYQIEQTIPGVKKLGSLRLKFRYGDEENYKPNDPAAYKEMDSYLFGVETSPYLGFLGTFGAKFEFTYTDGDFTRRKEQNLGEQWTKERNFDTEFDFYYPEKYLRIKPHFSYKKVRNYPDYNTWYTRKNGVRLEKDLNGRFRLVTDWTYINYSRNKDPFLPTANRLSSSAWKLENDLEYEFIRDWKLKLGLDYGNALGFDAFDYYTLRSELQLKKPGLTEFRLGYGHTNYFELDDSENTLLFKLGFFI